MAVGTVDITPGSGQKVAYDTNSILGAGAAVQIFSPANSDGSRQPFDPDGTPQVSPEPATLILDDFGVQAITVFHQVSSGNGGTTPAATNGNVPISAGTASGGYALVRSIYALWLRAGTYLKVAHIIAHEAAATVSSTRWWGYGVNQTTPTATAPVLNGAVFQLDSSAGALQAVTYSNGTKTVIATLTRLTDAAQHRYEVWYRQSVVYWVIDGALVATVKFPNLAVATGLYAITGSVNAAAITAPTFNLSSVSAVDQGGNNKTLSDGFNPAIQATVKAASTAVAATDFPLVVGLHPSSPVPAGANVIGAVAVGSTATRTSSFTTTTATNAATIVKAAACDLQSLLITNNSASTQWVKIYNTTAVTLGTTAAVIDIQIAAGATLTPNLGANGLRMTTGMAYSVTGAAGLTNNTAGAGSVSVAVTVA